MARKDEVVAPVIALLTDFGLSDPYAGVLKGVILGGAPDARLIDLTHEVPPQGVVEAAFLLENAWRYFPPGSIFLVVVDPGVGSGRRRIAVEANDMVFVGPDNGCLSAALGDAVRGTRRRGDAYKPWPARLDASVTAVSIENQSLFRAPVSATFEGRDVFAPSVAFLAAGGSILQLGPRVGEVQAFQAFRATADGDRLDGLIIHIDTYGNLISDIRATDVPDGARFRLYNREVPLRRTYSDIETPSLVAIAGSSGFIEIAWPGGNAAAVLDAAVGDEIECRGW